MFHKFYFHQVEKIASVGSYRTLKLWEIFYFTNSKFMKKFFVNKIAYGVFAPFLYNYFCIWPNFCHFLCPFVHVLFHCTMFIWLHVQNVMVF